ncbi:MAG: MarC family protein [Alphaproteobacteria bacterium]|nr:MarC family protein [Alphaproteobacteria bacterium]
MPDFLWQAFITLLVVIDPFAVVPMFVGLTRNETLANKRKTALKSCTIATIILLSFAFAGDKLLDAMSISEPAFRIAGGFLLLLTAIDMVMAKSHSGLVSTTTDEDEESVMRDDVSVFPLAIPMIAGPGALTSLVVLMRQAESMPFHITYGVVIVLLIVLVLTYISLLLGDQLMRMLGVTGTNVLTRVFGIILAALAVQSIINGVVIVIKGLM